MVGGNTGAHTVRASLALGTSLDKGMPSSTKFGGNKLGAVGSNMGSGGGVDKLIISGVHGTDPVRLELPKFIIVRFKEIGAGAGLGGVPGILHMDVKAGGIPWMR